MSALPPPPPPGPSPPPPPPPPPPARLKSHPAGTVGLVLSLCSIAPLPVVGGLLGSLVGAFGVRATRRSPQQWSPGSGNAAVAVGLIFGTGLGLVFALVRADDWGWIPFAVVLAHAAVVVGIAYGARNAVPGSMGVLAGTGLVLALALGLIAFLIFLGEFMWDAVFNSSSTD